MPQGFRLDLAGIDPAEHWAVIRGVARAAERGPFESVWVTDHFHTAHPTPEATHEAWSLMAALAATTSRVRLGQMCTCMGYRNPAYLAKVAATVDLISGGRVEMGIGAGWYEHEWRAYGYGFPPLGDRLGRLEEGVQIMRRLWTAGSASFDGKHYTVDGAVCRPLPLQEGGIPLWIAGGGEKKTLRIAAEYAAYTNFEGTAEVFRRKSGILAEHCRELGTDYDKIVRSANYNVIIGATEKDVQDRLDWLRAHYSPYLPADQVERNLQLLANGPLVGTPEKVAEQLTALRGIGVTYAIFNFPEVAYDKSGLDLFVKEVAPALAAL